MGYDTVGAEHLRPYYRLMINGMELLPELHRRLTSITANHRHEKSMMMTLKFRDEKLQFVDLDIWSKGAKWYVYLGHLNNYAPFGPLGVESYQMDFNTSNYCDITVVLQDKGRSLGKDCKWRTWNGYTLTDVVKQIATEQGLGYKVEGTDKVLFSDNFPSAIAASDTIAPGALPQPGISDGALLQQVATKYGYRFELDGVNIIFTNRQENADGLSKHKFAWGVWPRSLMSFTPAQKTYGGPGKGKGTKGQAGATKCIGNVDIPAGVPFLHHTTPEDAAATVPGGTEAIENGGPVKPSDDVSEGTQPEVTLDVNNAVRESYGTTDADKVSGQYNEFVGPVLVGDDGEGDRPQTEAEVDNLVGAKKAGTKGDTAFAKAVLTVANPFVKKGDLCEVIGVGQRFSGEWRITEWEHVLDSRGIRTTLSLGKKGLGASPDTKTVEDNNGESDGNEPAFQRWWDIDGNKKAGLGLAGITKDGKDTVVQAIIRKEEK